MSGGLGGWLLTMLNKLKQFINSGQFTRYALILTLAFSISSLALVFYLTSNVLSMRSNIAYLLEENLKFRSGELPQFQSQDGSRVKLIPSFIKTMSEIDSRLRRLEDDSELIIEEEENEKSRFEF
jgi:hypothetical protein|tara:strand:+ start:3137 stop:3511 length:375 start_codon:yes stop_codon:yes gene_type:complete